MNNAKQDRDNGHYEQDVYDGPGIVTEEANGPKDNQHNSKEIEDVAHGFRDKGLNFKADGELQPLVFVTGRRGSAIAMVVEEIPARTA